MLKKFLFAPLLVLLLTAGTARAGVIITVESSVSEYTVGVPFFFDVRISANPDDMGPLPDITFFEIFDAEIASDGLPDDLLVDVTEPPSDDYVFSPAAAPDGTFGFVGEFDPINSFASFTDELFDFNAPVTILKSPPPNQLLARLVVTPLVDVGAIELKIETEAIEILTGDPIEGNQVSVDGVDLALPVAPASAVIPEPASLVIWSLLGGIGMIRARRKKRA